MFTRKGVLDPPSLTSDRLDGLIPEGSTGDAGDHRSGPHQIPFTNTPHPSPTFGREVSSGNEAEVLTLEEILSNPTLAENQLHAVLTRRALKWLAILEKEGERDPTTGKIMVDLDLQVSMFNTIANWLKTSKKTKSEEESSVGVPGIDQMRALVREELEGKATAPPTRRPVVEPDVEEAPHPGTPIIKRQGRPRREPDGDDTYLALELQRARQRAAEDGAF